MRTDNDLTRTTTRKAVERIVRASWGRLARGSAVLALLSRSDEQGPIQDEELSIAETIAGLPG